MLGGVLISIGVQLGTVSSHRARLAKLERGAAGQGERLEKHNVRIALVEYRIGVRRPSSVSMPAPDESSDRSEP